MQWIRGSYTISCDPAEQDLAVISKFLATSYWAKGIPVETVKRSLDNALCFALLENGRQIGFARVVTDYATFAYLGDVFVLPEYRGKGLGQWLVECVVEHPMLQGLRRWMLATLDAQELYRKLGFKELKRPEMIMERHDADIYTHAD